MSILYLGPYRQSDINGQISRFFLSNIKSANNSQSIISRPVYIEKPSSVLSSKIKFDTEHKTLANKYDILIQHLPIEHIQFMPDIADNHYAFPIIENIENMGIAGDNFAILKYFDKVFVQSEKEKIIIQNIHKLNNIEIFSPNINLEEFNKIIKQKYSFTNYEGSTKFYFIGNLNQDESIIKKIIFAMYASTADLSISPICVFFLDFDTTPNIEALDNDIKEIRSNFGLPDNHRKEIFIFKHFPENELIIAHGSCDIYLSLNDQQTYYLHEKYASLCGNTIISLDDIYDTIMPLKNTKYNYSYGIYKRYVSSVKLIKTLKQYL